MTIHTPEKKKRRRAERNAALMDGETLEFIKAIDDYRRRFDRAFPAWSEVLDILRALGYRKVAEPIPIGRLCEIVEASPVDDSYGSDADSEELDDPEPKAD